MEERNNSDKISFKLMLQMNKKFYGILYLLQKSNDQHTYVFECNFTKRIKEMNSQIKYNEENLKKKR